MKIAVLGGSGFIGQHLVTALAARGHSVISISKSLRQKNADGLTGDRVTHAACNLNETEKISDLIHEADVVFHLISTTKPKSSNDDPVSDLQDNTLATLKIIHRLAYATRRPRFIFASSGGTVYGVNPSEAIAEDSPTNPICAYGISKLGIEKYLHLYQYLTGFDYITLRLANPYGLGSRVNELQGFIPVALSNAINNTRIDIWGDGSVIRDYIYITDVIEALICAMQYEGDQRTFNIGTQTGCSIREVLSIIKDVTLKELSINYISPRSFDAQRNVLDISRARHELAWHPEVKTQEGIATLYNLMKVQQ